MNGRKAYEADVARQPNYPDGTPRKTWDQLRAIEQWSWGRDMATGTYLDFQAKAFMDRRPDLRPMSLDEWLAQHHDQLTETERQEGYDLLAKFD
ncbi:hypothetical protein [Roseovarius sp. MMSF_3281]|uniref:hypothetical protein n=1 Tax=Roseovarius sp. MMSF_3281 TaxID=3046694 RepID=UPI00273DC0E0|nr:hypothetical protein [Roseovarius sp. MMSF_3281]